MPRFHDQSIWLSYFSPSQIEQFLRMSEVQDYWSLTRKIEPGARVPNHPFTNDELAQLEQNGFVRLTNVLKESTITEVKSLIGSLSNRLGQQRSDEHHYTEYMVERTAGLATKDIRFLELAADSRIVAAGQHILDGDGVKIYSMNYREPQPSAPSQGWHIDSGVCLNLERTISFTAIWFLDDTTAINGATGVLPGSHRIPFGPKNDTFREDLPGEVIIECKAGDVLILDGNLWHRGRPNITSDEKPGRILGFYISDNVLWDDTCGFRRDQVEFSLEEVQTERMRKILSFRKTERKKSGYS